MASKGLLNLFMSLYIAVKRGDVRHTYNTCIYLQVNEKWLAFESLLFVWPAADFCCHTSPSLLTLQPCLISELTRRCFTCIAATRPMSNRLSSFPSSELYKTRNWSFHVFMYTSAQQPNLENRYCICVCNSVFGQKAILQVGCLL